MQKPSRTVEVRMEEIDRKIAYHTECIRKLEVAKANLIAPPKQRKTRLGVKSVIEKAKEAGLTPEEMLEKLGLKK